MVMSGENSFFGAYRILAYRLRSIILRRFSVITSIGKKIDRIQKKYNRKIIESHTILTRKSHLRIFVTNRPSALSSPKARIFKIARDFLSEENGMENMDSELPEAFDI